MYFQSRSRRYPEGFLLNKIDRIFIEYKDFHYNDCINYDSVGLVYHEHFDSAFLVIQSG